MSLYSVWKDLIKPTIFAYIIVCAILAEIVGAYYLYANYSIIVDLFASIQPHNAAHTEMYHGLAKRVDTETMDQLCNYIGIEIRRFLYYIKVAGD